MRQVNDADRLKVIEARLRQATPGPWRGECGDIVTDNLKTTVAFMDLDATRYNGNVAFIANAPDDIAFLLKRIGSLEEDAADAQDTHNECERFHDALRKIARGCKDPEDVADDAINQ